MERVNVGDAGGERLNMIKSVGLFTLYCVLYCEISMKSCG